jgi:hypothetical protein
MHSLDHVHKEPESEVQTEQLQVEETNTEFDQGKPHQTVQHVDYWERHRQCLLVMHLRVQHRALTFICYVLSVLIQIKCEYEQHL